MPKGYWIGRVTVNDPDTYPEYIKAGASVYEKFGGVFVVRGGQCESLEGNNKTRNVVVEWPDYATAKAAYESPEYQTAKAIRERCADADFLIVEGV
jgi:uncharacterized protein (DUF1330 family)